MNNAFYDHGIMYVSAAQARSYLNGYPIIRGDFHLGRGYYRVDGSLYTYVGSNKREVKREINKREIERKLA